MMRVIFTLTAILLMTDATSMSRSGSTPDRFYLNYQGIRDTPCAAVAGKTLASQTINTGIRNLVLITAGQSNSEAISSSLFTPTNPTKLDNFNIYDGAIYTAVEPIVGAGCNGLGNGWIGHHFGIVLADALVTANKFDRVIIMPISFGGSSMADWSTGVLRDRFTVAFARLAQRGIVAGSNVTIAICWGQGEAETTLATSQASYVAMWNAMWATIQAAGFTGRIFVAKETYLNGSTNAGVQSAQTVASPSGVINNGSGIYLGANSDALIGSICNGANACRQGDNIHYTAPNGIIAYSTDTTHGWQKALANSGAPF